MKLDRNLSQLLRIGMFVTRSRHPGDLALHEVQWANHFALEVAIAACTQATGKEAA